MKGPVSLILDPRFTDQVGPHSEIDNVTISGSGTSATFMRRGAMSEVHSEADILASPRLCHLNNH
jgi:hypothetical protein